MRRPVPVAAVAALLLTAAPASGAVRTHRPLADAAQSGFTRVFGGASTNRNAFALRTAGRRLHSALVWADMRCDNGDTATFSGPVAFEAQAPSAIPLGESVLVGNRTSRSGSFDAGGSGSADYGTSVGTLAHRLRGRVRGASATGAYEVTLTLTDKATRQPVTTCRSGRLAWRAVSASGRVFGGLTNDGRPVVVELRPSRRVVRTLHMGWAADCTPSGSFSLSDSVGNFGISRTGRFGNPFSGRVPIEGGAAGEREFAYTLNGRVRGRRASGTFSVTVTDRDPAGTVTSTCRTGTVAFRATSSRR